ncbi:MAG: hypothetical protein GXO44_03465 [Deferribacteres bacterium]|nr:hypothetical protein [Deferribacteres bacterium]
MEEMERKEEIRQEEVSNNASEEVKVEEKKKGNGKVVAYVAVVIAIIALVLSLANMGVRNTVKEVKSSVNALKQETASLAQKENILEVKNMQINLLTELDRIYALTLVERNYEAAAKELAKVESAFERIKGALTKQQEQRISGLLASLKAEIEKGPSPIPKLISEIRTCVSSISIGSKTAAKAEKSAEKPAKAFKAQKSATSEKVSAEKGAEKKSVTESRKEAKKLYIVKPGKIEEKELKKAEETKGEIKELKKPEAKEKETSLKKAYEFWKNLGQKLVKK